MIEYVPSGYEFVGGEAIIANVWKASMASFTKEVNSWLVKRPLVFNGRLADIIAGWGRVTHICVSKLAIIDSDIGMSPGRRQAIIWTNAGLLLIGP